MRFHSWCPPEAAFAAADQAGFYLQVECSAWATIGDGAPIDQYINEESQRMVDQYGNHPSFCMLTYGNEPSGKNHVQYLTDYDWSEYNSKYSQPIVSHEIGQWCVYPDLAGFQLLDLHDFPGQGTTLVGVLNALWEEKGYISPEEFKRLCNSTVPLARM